LRLASLVVFMRGFVVADDASARGAQHYVEVVGYGADGFGGLAGRLGLHGHGCAVVVPWSVFVFEGSQLLQGLLAGENKGRTTAAATTYQAWEIEGELPLPHGDGDGCSVLQADRMGESRTPGGIAVVSTVWGEEGFGHKGSSL
jgi:hypothetical protein